MQAQVKQHAEVNEEDYTDLVSSSSKQEGFHLRWSRIDKRVPGNDASAAGGGLFSGLFQRKGISGATQDSSRTEKQILCEVSGYAAPGEVLAVMGPSGAGKTSLMNVLSGRATFNSGIYSINGEKINPQLMKRLMSKIAYVKQNDIFFNHLTVRDQLTYTALLRLPSTNTNHNKEVENIIRMLRLTKVADSNISMISGGEKKRVNIGTELLTDPFVLLCDEPTSGLDSTSAVSLLQLLQSLARNQGKTIITSIHQPSSAVFRSFDRLIMLSDGCVVYFGDPVASLEYLRQRDLICPDGYNAADHWMDLLVQDSAVDEERKESHNCVHDEQLSLTQSPRKKLQSSWDNAAVAEAMDLALTSNATLLKRFEKQSKYNTSWLTQYYVLTHRALQNSRSAIFTPLNLCKSVAIGIVAGLLWFQMDYTEKNINDIRSYYFFTMTFWVFDSMFTALTAFPSERVVIMKERASASYHLSAYFMAKTTSDAPVRLILPMLYMIVSFWMMGIDSRFLVFVGTIGCTLLSVLSGEAIGLFIGAAIYDLQKALTIMTVFTLFLMLLGGFFVENIPDFIKWGKFISPFKYAFDSALLLIFDRDVPCDGSGTLGSLCDGNDTAEASLVRDFIGIQGSLGFNVGLLLLLGMLPRYGAYLALRTKKANERS